MRPKRQAFNLAIDRQAKPSEGIHQYAGFLITDDLQAIKRFLCFKRFLQQVVIFQGQNGSKPSNSVGFRRGVIQLKTVVNLIAQAAKACIMPYALLANNR
ncbi:MAG: hypothetical protein NT075_21085 [Chloroflexi bacterium]|nr:hypothetical protein [Chloroflexota bacterium]